MPIFFYLFATALIYNALLILIVRVARHRLGPRVSRFLIAIGFTAATGYTLWRVEWFDVWRHGIPSNPSLLSVYAAYLAVYATVGWLVGTLVAPGPGRIHRFI